MSNNFLKPMYRQSWALIIGINEYSNVPPLNHAINDAMEIAKIFREKFEFPKENIKLLIDEEAKKEKILSSYLEFANGKVDINDRVLVFFAGHGHTITGNNGDVGFLIPYDGEQGDISTYIRWDELTRNSELIPAKHIFFIMDACYGGLVITRSLESGNMRFLKDMLKRTSRQVLTAGKANEKVSDSGGPLPNHSIFTGHLIKGLEGEAANKDGLITANNVMHYVYKKVSSDIDSNQTPHFGFLEGDGDFIINDSIIETLKDGNKKGNDDLLFEIPYILEENSLKSEKKRDIIEKTKEYLSDERYRIKLEEIAIKEVKKVLTKLNKDNFPLDVAFTKEKLKNRIDSYESIINDLQNIMMCISYWGNENYRTILEKIISRIAESPEDRSGNIVWSSLQWYPIILLVYSSGISAIEANNYKNLKTLLLTAISQRNENIKENVLFIGEAINNYKMKKVFENLYDDKNYYVPMSEYLFKLLQPSLDDLFFLGKDYESKFDNFEIFLALVYADINQSNNSRIWGPIGRFGWKYRSRRNDPYSKLKSEAEAEKNEWLPIKAGLFNGTYNRFKEVSEDFEETILKSLNWY